MTNHPPDAALRIARFCWPEKVWLMGNIRTPRNYASDDFAYVSKTGEHFYLSPDDVRAAELALIERGLAEEYGGELCCELFGMTAPSTARDACGLATAPLDIRVRAILAVIEQQEKKQ